MSLNQLILDEIKPYMNIRVNDITVDGDIIGPGSTDTFQQVYDNSNPPVIEYDPAKNIQIKNDSLDSNTLMFAITDNADTKDYLRVESNRFTAINSTVASDNSFAIGENNDIDASSEGFILGKNNSLTAGNGFIIDSTNNQLNNSIFQGGIIKGQEGIMFIGSNLLSNPLPNAGADTCDHFIYQTAKASVSGATTTSIFNYQTANSTSYMFEFDIIAQQTNGSLEREIMKRRIIVNNSGVLPITAIEDAFIRSNVGVLAPIPIIAYDVSTSVLQVTTTQDVSQDITYLITVKIMQYSY